MAPGHWIFLDLCQQEKMVTGRPLTRCDLSIPHVLPSITLGSACLGQDLGLRWPPCPKIGCIPAAGLFVHLKQWPHCPVIGCKPVTGLFIHPTQSILTVQ